MQGAPPPSPRCPSCPGAPIHLFLPQIPRTPALTLQLYAADAEKYRSLPALTRLTVSEFREVGSRKKQRGGRAPLNSERGARPGTFGCVSPKAGSVSLRKRGTQEGSKMAVHLEEKISPRQRAPRLGSPRAGFQQCYGPAAVCPLLEEIAAPVGPGASLAPLRNNQSPETPLLSGLEILLLE